MKFINPFNHLKLIAAIISISCAARAYFVRRGDTLSKIAAKNISTPVYGKNGSLEKILLLNPQIKNADVIIPGQEISLAAPAKEPEFVTSSPERPTVPRKGHAILSVTPEFMSTEIKGIDRLTGAQAHLASKSNFGLTASYGQSWSDNFRTEFYFGLNKLSMKEPGTGGAIANAEQTLFSFGASAGFLLDDEIMVDTGISLSQRPYLKAISESTVNIDATAVPNIFVQSSYDFFKMDPFTIGSSFQVSLDLPTEADGYKTNSNYSYEADIFNKEQISPAIQTEVGLEGRYLQENTSISDQTQIDYGIFFKFQYAFGQGQDQ